MVDRIPPVMLDPTGGAAGQVPTINAAGTAVEYGTPAGGGPGAATVAVKAADQSSGSTTLDFDTELDFPIAANESWVCTFVLRVTCASATPDVKVAVTAPTGATGTVVSTGPPTGATTVEASQRTLSGAALGGGGASFGVVSTATQASSLIEVRATVTNGATAGSVRLQFAQLNLDAANPVTVLAGSYLVAHRVGGGAYGVPTAAEVTYAGSTNLVATNVEAALDELDAEKAGTGHTHGKFVRSRYNSGTVTVPAGGAVVVLNNVVAGTPTPIQATVAAVAGDVLHIFMNTQAADAVAATMDFNVGTFVAGAEVNRLASNTIGGWAIRDIPYYGQSASAHYVVQPSDVSGGNVNLRLMGLCSSGVSRDLFSTAATPLDFSVHNLGDID